MKVYFYTLGCKVNQYETESMSELFKKAGNRITDNPDEADVIIVNSCTVTSISDQKTRQSVRKFKRNNPDAVVVLTGCMPQAYPEKARALEEADIVTGNKDHSLVLKLTEQFLAAKKDEKLRLFSVDAHTKGDTFEDTQIGEFSGRTRAFIKIQDGCDRYCSYCIIPTSKGRSRSRSFESLNAELDKIKATGFKEVVLVGINFCCYGLDIGKTFTDAIELACNKGFERVRIGSLEFDNISDEAIDRLAALPNFCPQFHISLQSGCDAILKKMNRHYTCDEFETLCTKLREKFTDAVITTDLMVGFPTESDENFKQSLEFVRKIGFEKVHVFPYSPRPGTKAAEMTPQIEKQVKEKRCHEAMAAAETIRMEFLKKQIGKTEEMLCETYKDGFVSGYTKNYTPVKFKAERAMQNQMVTVQISDVRDDCCIAELFT